MSERRTIGAILTGVGRITEEDVATALAYQRERGGYFGEALVACDLLTAEEVEWGLASQFDLPYVFPDAEAVDPEAAAMVSLEWALSNLVLPIMRTDRSLRVVVDSPLKSEPIDTLRALTNLDVELALAAPATIRELIRQVFARRSASDDEGPRGPMDLAVALEAVHEVGAPRFGISVRGLRAHVWWDERGTIRRRPLSGDWVADLEQALTPAPADRVADVRRAEWEAEFRHAGLVSALDVRYIADDMGCEYLFRPATASAPETQRFAPPVAGIVSEVQLLARSGTARFIVVVDPPELGPEILPHLPALLLDPAWRCIHVTSGDDPGRDGTLSLRVSVDSERWAAEIEELRAFHFDVVTADLSRGDIQRTGSALDIASVAFLLWSKGQATAPALEAGIRWRLGIAREAGDHLEWTLEPLHPGVA
jgi:hypothetical protein